jgi:hypothetical protein
MNIGEITSILKKHNPPDVAEVDYISKSVHLIPSLDYDTPIFCDSVILWSLEENRINEIYHKCKKHLNTSFKINFLKTQRSISELTMDDIAPKGTKYFPIKISLSEVSIKKAIHFLEDTISHNLILHDIDITQDIPYITNRNIVEKHILKKGIKKEYIVDDLHKVGKNCISFYSKDPLTEFSKGTLLRIKVYNKFVQMLESCDVRSTIGSRIHNLFVDPTDPMKEILERTKEVGITRIEIKFYGKDIQKSEYYLKNFVKNKNKYIQGCSFYEVSLENQWKKLIEKIHKKQVIMTYITEQCTFAYCHWWNSLTRKMQGGYKKITPADNLETLIANFTFNGMSTKLIIINSNEEKIKKYKRTSESITLIPGPQGGLYPRKNAETSPENVGLTEYLGIKIGWPNFRIKPSNQPLSNIMEISESEEMEEITRFTGYKAAYTTLNTYSTYRTIAKGLSKWREKQYLFLNVIDHNNTILKIRCGEKLHKLILDKTKKTYFHTENLTYKNRDINVRLAKF